MKRLLVGASVVWMATTVLTGCTGNTKPNSLNPGKASSATGISYASKDKEGFKVSSFKGQPAGPNMVFIEGGRFTMGTVEEDVTFTRDNLERTVTVASFYMDETEIANVHWLEYLYAVQKDSSYEFYESALPDTTVWVNRMSFNDQYIDQYLRYPGFRLYPVVGVSWLQANDYCKWRTEAVNSDILARNTPQQKAPRRGRQAEATAEAAPKTMDGRRTAIESGIVLPAYRLPTEAEWEYAAKAMIGTQFVDENQVSQRIYPWDGSSMRNSKGKERGEMRANFKRGRGDYAGIAGRSNDGAIITTEIYSYSPNDYGLYNMAGNVNEWVYDLYRPNSYQDFNDLNPIRRNDYMDEASNYDRKNYNSLIDNTLRVYKGGSWNDVAYWLSPGTRRFLPQDSSTATIGFRCAMIAIGPKGKSM